MIYFLLSCNNTEIAAYSDDRFADCCSYILMKSDSGLSFSVFSVFTNTFYKYVLSFFGMYGFTKELQQVTSLSHVTSSQATTPSGQSTLPHNSPTPSTSHILAMYHTVKLIHTSSQVTSLSHITSSQATTSSGQSTLSRKSSTLFTQLKP